MTFPLVRNLSALYVIKVAKWMNLVMPIIVLFYQSNGLTMQDIFTLKAIYSIALMVLEIPTGYFADVAGRKTSIFLGSLFGFAGYMIYATSSGFWEFVVAETVLGTGMSLVSGADSAMLYDSLSTAGKQSKYTRYEGRIISLGNFAEALAGIVGGIIAVVSLRMPFFIQSGVAFLAVPAALMLREPPVRGPLRKPGFRDIGSIVMLVMRGDRRLFWNTMFSAMTGVSTLTMAWFVQPWMIGTGIRISLFGVVWAALNLTVGLTAMVAWRIDDWLGARKTTILFTFTLITGWFGLALTVAGWLPAGDMLLITAGLVFLLLFYSGRGVATPTLRNYINIITSSDIRATVLSVRNFLIRGFFAILGPLFGYLTDAISLAVALGAAGVIFSLLTLFTLYFFLRHQPP